MRHLGLGQGGERRRPGGILVGRQPVVAERARTVAQQEGRNAAADVIVLQVLAQRHGAGREIGDVALHVGIHHVLGTEGPVVDDRAELFHVARAFKAADRGQLVGGAPPRVLDGNGRRGVRLGHDRAVVAARHEEGHTAGVVADIGAIDVVHLAVAHTVDEITLEGVEHLLFAVRVHGVGGQAVAVGPDFFAEVIRDVDVVVGQPPADVEVAAQEGQRCAGRRHAADNALLVADDDVLVDHERGHVQAQMRVVGHDRVSAVGMLPGNHPPVGAGAVVCAADGRSQQGDVPDTLHIPVQAVDHRVTDTVQVPPSAGRTCAPFGRLQARARRAGNGDDARGLEEVRDADSIVHRGGAREILGEERRAVEADSFADGLVGRQAHGAVDHPGIEAELEGEQLADDQRVDRRPALDLRELQRAVLGRQLVGRRQEGVDAVGIGLDPGFLIGRHVLPGFQCAAAKAQRAQLDIAAQGARAEQFGQGPGGYSAKVVHLEQAVAGVQEATHVVDVVFGVADDRRDTVGVGVDGNRRGQLRHRHGLRVEACGQRKAADQCDQLFHPLYTPACCDIARSIMAQTTRGTPKAGIWRHLGAESRTKRAIGRPARPFPPDHAERL